MFEDYDNGKGYYPNYNFDRFNFRSNIDAALTHTTKLKFDISGFTASKIPTSITKGVQVSRPLDVGCPHRLAQTFYPDA